MRLLFGMICISLVSKVYGQLEQYANYGFNVGFVAALGTHVQRVGVVVQAYSVYRFAQVNASLRLYGNLKNLGPNAEYAEINAAAGICLGYGKRTADTNLFVSSIGNQTGYKNAIAYSYNVWCNKIRTSQVTGIIAFQFDKISVIAENDLLAKPALDRFRTGAFLIQYQRGNVQYGVNCTLWTGQFFNTVKNDTLFPHKGYLSTQDALYGNVSHGLLSAQVKVANPYGQYIQANAGVDAEQVRNVVQNRIIHDMVFLPKKWNGLNNNVHIPMINSQGGQYLYRKDEKVRKPKPYINMYLSPAIFY